MQPEMIATRWADSERGEVRAALATGVPCSVLRGDAISPGIFEKLSAFFRQWSFSLEVLFWGLVKLGLILHWQPQSAPQGFAVFSQSLAKHCRLNAGNANREIGVPR